MASIANYAGLNTSQFGRTYEEIGEDEERERCTYIRWDDPDFDKIAGKANNAIVEICYVGDSETLHQRILDEDWTVYPSPYPYY